jgi:hypothetical protein
MTNKYMKNCSTQRNAIQNYIEIPSTQSEMLSPEGKCWLSPKDEQMFMRIQGKRNT